MDILIFLDANYVIAIYRELIQQLAKMVHVAVMRKDSANARYCLFRFSFSFLETLNFEDIGTWNFEFWKIAILKDIFFELYGKYVLEKCGRIEMW